MSPKIAQRTAQHARRLLTAKLITPHDYAVLDTLLWRVRRHGRADLTATYKTLARLASVSRDTAIGSVGKLVDLGVIQKIKRRVKVRWGRGRECLASRQIDNGYVFLPPPTESAPPATDKGEERINRESPLEKALTRLGTAVSGFIFRLPECS